MMGSWPIFVMTIVTAGAMTLLLLIVRPPRRMTPGRSVAEISARLAAEDSGPILELLSGHAAPDHRLEVPAAHRAMREHLACAVATCPHKAAAFEVLVEAGHVQPRAAALLGGNSVSGRHAEPVAADH